MSDRFAAAYGRKVVSSVSAEEVGNVTRLVVDTEHRRIVAVVVGKRRKARLVEWESVSAFGADAIMITDEGSLHEPRDDREEAAVRGDLELLHRRVLSDLGSDLGNVDDVVFDAEAGTLEAVVTGGHEHPAASRPGAGSYAVVRRAHNEAPAV
jgi:uncharacterized protein YrrD